MAEEQLLVDGDHLTLAGAKEVIKLMKDGKTINTAHPMDGQHQWSWSADADAIVHIFLSVHAPAGCEPDKTTIDIDAFERKLCAQSTAKSNTQASHARRMLNQARLAAPGQEAV